MEPRHGPTIAREVALRSVQSLGRRDQVMQSRVRVQETATICTPDRPGRHSSGICRAAEPRLGSFSARRVTPAETSLTTGSVNLRLFLGLVG